MDALMLLSNNPMVDLAKAYNDLKDAKLKAAGGDYTPLAYAAIDLDLGSLLLQILPILANMISGGLALPGILALAKVLIGLLLKDQDLGNALYSIIEALMKVFVKS